MRYFKLILIISLYLLISCLFDSDSSESDPPVAFYPFSGNATDVMGNSPSPFIKDAVLTEDRFGNAESAYFFNGNGDYIDTNGIWDFSSRSVSIWFRPDTEELESVAQQRILDRGGFGNRTGILRLAIVDGKLTMYEGGTVGEQVTDDTLETGKWYHFVMSRGDSSTVYYINGVRLGETDIGFGDISSSGYQRTVLATNRNRNNHFFHGAIDDLRVYDYAITNKQVLGLFLEGGWPR